MSTLVDTWRSRRPSDWDWTKLRFVARVGTGHTPDRNKPEYWVDCDIPWVTAADLSSRTSALEPLMDTAQQVSELGVANSAAVVHPPGTVMFCRTASIGLFCITGREMATTQAFVTWTAGERLDPRYLLYVVAALGPEFDRLAYGSTHMTIYMPDLEAIEVPVPPLEEQRRIADFLDDQITRIDAVVSAQQRQLVALDETVTSAISETLGALPQATTPSLPLKYLCCDGGQYGLNISPDEYRDAGVRLLRTSDLSSSGEVSRAAVFLDHVPERRFLVEEGDLLLSRSGTVGQAFLVPASLHGSAFAGFLIRYRANRRIMEPRFLWYASRSSAFQSAVEADAVTSTISNFNAEKYANLRVPAPSVVSQASSVRALDQAIASLENLRSTLTIRMGHLHEYKRSLITAAVMGEFDVASARRGVPA